MANRTTKDDILKITSVITIRVFMLCLNTMKHILQPEIPRNHMYNLKDTKNMYWERRFLIPVTRALKNLQRER